MKKIVLVGLGSMGKNHARILNENWPGTLIQIVDPAYGESHYFDIPVAKNFDALKIDELSYDAAIIASPTELHYSHACFFLNRGVNVFLEKPICEDVEEAKKLIAISERKNKKLFIGHIERYNPTVKAIKEYLDSGAFGNIFTISTNRVGISPARDPDLSVSLDLLIHDVDICNYLIGAAPKSAGLIEHSAVSINRSDIATIILKYDEKKSATCHANWITPYKEREIQIATSSGLIRADFISQQWSVFTSKMVDNKVMSYEVQMPVNYSEPLKLEHEFFQNYLDDKIHYSPWHAVDVLTVLKRPNIRIE